MATPCGRGLVRLFGQKRADVVARQLADCLRPGSRVLDVGAGTCQIARTLEGAGHDVTALDLRDLSCYPDYRAVIFPGEDLPFPGDSFDEALLLFVLHHVADPAAHLREAARVARRVVVYEDVYVSQFHRRYSLAVDRVANLELCPERHGHRREKGWEELFLDVGLTVDRKRRLSLFPGMTNVLYCLS